MCAASGAGGCTKAQSSIEANQRSSWGSLLPWDADLHLAPGRQAGHLFPGAHPRQQWVQALLHHAPAPREGWGKAQAMHSMAAAAAPQACAQSGLKRCASQPKVGRQRMPSHEFPEKN